LDILATAWLLVYGYVEVGEAKEVLRTFFRSCLRCVTVGPTVRCVALRRVTLPTEWKMGLRRFPYFTQRTQRKTLRCVRCVVKETAPKARK